MNKQKKVGLAALATTILTLSNGLVAANTAFASPSSDNASTSSIRRVSASCEAAIANVINESHRKISSEVCLETVVTSIGAAKVMQVSDLPLVRAKLSNVDYASLSTAVVAGAVKSRPYSQQVNNITDSETQSGVFYYDGVRAWVTTTYRGTTGSHLCFLDWAVGYSAALQGCYETGSSSERTLSQRWLFTPFVNGFPLSWSETYSIRVNAKGGVL